MARRRLRFAPMPTGVAGLALALALAFALSVTPARVVAVEPGFGTPTASAALGDPLIVTSTISDVDGGSVELLVRLADNPTTVVVSASPGTAAGEWQATAAIDVATSSNCACFAAGQSAPNTNIEYQFRVRAADGTVNLGPVGRITVSDDRFEWRTLEQDLVRVHWYEGTDAFAQAAADVSNDAIDRAAALLGSTLPEPVDLFVYATQDALLEAVSPSRESIAGEAHSDIATMFVWLPPNQDPDRSATVVAHELTHLVFNETTENLYHEPPRWLNEGIAVYLSEGYSAYFRSVVNAAVRNGTLIPLQGLAGLFPSPRDQFELAYGQSVAAVDFFISTYGEETLWDLVRSYAAGLSDDDAFTAATGGDMAAFNAAWMGSLNVEVPPPVGPQPAPAGPIPDDWTEGGEPGQPTAPPGATAAPGETALPSGEAPQSTPAASPRPGESPPTADSPTTDLGEVLVGALVGVLIFVLGLGIIAFLRNRRPPSEPPPGWPTPPASGPPPSPPSPPSHW